MPFDFQQMNRLTSQRHLLPNGDIVGLVVPVENTKEYHLGIAAQHRELLIERVNSNELTPDEAEAEAKDMRSGPLASLILGCDELNADMTFWTLEMTAAWIKAKRPEAVHRHYRPSFLDKWVWEKLATYHDGSRIYLPWEKPMPANVRPCYALRRLKKTRIDESYVDFDGKTKVFKKMAEFMPKLKAHLESGEILSVGQPIGPDYQSSQIEPGLWVIAHFGISDADGLFLSLNDKTIYRDIRFKSTHVLKMYPDARVRTRPTAHLPWRKGIELDEKKAKIVNTLMECYPDGLPDWRPKKVRDFELRSVLPAPLLAQWYPDGVIEVDDNALEKPHNAFQKAMDRIFSSALLSN
ncbi:MULTISPECIES: hypothetical protein [unclassified Rhizobium]|uniref:hypothetical protein n=1 Tax=unclassified Rhizobium TaxID=2613769 RepID=UPI001AEAF75F|nr:MULTISPECIES: hypothetical protein [unclassified Rhizobium]MBP2463780.1 hypothetical protein [Rhizobium sp. PvP014]MBP2532005.1 hypothetical protein [Rhizobium sp. PvP099]